MSRIPIKAAKELSSKFDQSKVIIVAWDAKTRTTNVVTYGKSLLDSIQSAKVGNRIKQEILEWPEEMCNAEPARAKRVGGSDKYLNKIAYESILKMTGHN